MHEYTYLIIAGIDEAGRGAVIGPLVIAGASFKHHKIDRLKELGVVDSKILSSKKRESIFDKIVREAESIFICKIKPFLIDSYVNKNRLNRLEAKFMTIISDNLIANKIIIDCCDINLERFKSEIKNNLINNKITIYTFHKADKDNVIVSAASIIAKVTRDNEIKKIKKILDQEVGSGYPSDPKTKVFLKANYLLNESHPFIRQSWKPIKSMMEKYKQTKLF